MRGWGNLSFEKSKTNSTVKGQGKTDGKFRTILHSKQRIKYDALKFLLVGSIATKENTQRHVNYPVTFECKKAQFFFKFIYLFLAVLGLRFCARAFSSCGKRGPLFIAVRGPLTIAASLVAEHRLQTRRLSSCGSRA